MNKKIIIANWKANPSTTVEAEKIFSSVSDSLNNLGQEMDIIICPPFIYLKSLSKIESDLKLGAQDVFWENSGPYTGEITPNMIKNLNIDYVLAGHSERRYKLGETDEIVNKKIKALLKNNLIPIFFFGEKDKTGDKESFIKNQLQHGLDGLNSEEIRKIIFAYEPVWAISTSENPKPATPDDLNDAIVILKKVIGDDAKVIYGGSVNGQNVGDFASVSGVSGVAVGGASLDPEQFAKIINTLDYKTK